MKTAVYAGRFDPITKGQYDIITRSSRLFDHLVVVLYPSFQETGTFPIELRLRMLEKVIAAFPNVSVQLGEGLIVDVAKKLDAHVLIRGIRAVMNYEHELQQASTNMAIDSSIETVFLLARPEYSFITSSAVNEIAYNHGNIARFVPECIISDIETFFSGQSQK